MENIKALITDLGDSSVGIPTTSWEVECPFNKDSVDANDKETLEWFRNKLKELYEDFAEGRLIVEYDFEMEYSQFS